ncbi:MAG: hypothetical protein JXQ75_07710 [Phycisphaerae bacterium]|nr:hypothetical protein [Phycisphaerae bacterium]
MAFDRVRRRLAGVTVTWNDLGLIGPQSVRSLWTRCDEGRFDEEYSTLVPGHGAVMLKVGPAPSGQDVGNGE